MDKERAKELLPIIKAFANGEEIEAYDKETGEWYKVTIAGWDDVTPYRIKPKYETEPYTFKELCRAINEHNGYVKYKDFVCIVGWADENYVTLLGRVNGLSYAEFQKSCTWLDDETPCGRIINNKKCKRK